MKGLITAATVALCLAPASAGAAVITPNTTADEYDNVTPNATCSLREAVKSMDGGADLGGCAATGAYNSNDTIQLPPGEYKLTIPPGADESGTGDLDFIHDLEVNALPGGPVEIDGNLTDRIFQYSTSLTIRGITLTGGFVDNPAMGSAVSGGAIFSSSGSSLTISNSTISGNRADGFGGGIAANGPTSLTNVTISGNTTTEGGGGGLSVGNDATLALDHATVTGNMSTHNSISQAIVAGGIYSQATTAPTVHNSIIAGNTDANDTFDAPDCQGTLTSQGGNVIGDTTDCTFNSVASDSLNQPALLAPLADNGGTTQTHALLAGSPAFDRGVVACQLLDQRGASRANGASCDSGSYEPQVDSDGDGLLDPSDNCRTQAGPPSNGGCPLPPPPPPAQVPLTPLPAVSAENPECAVLRAKLKKAKAALKAAKSRGEPTAKKQRKVRKLRAKLRALGC